MVGDFNIYDNDIITLWYMILTLSWQRPLSYRNQSIDLQSKSMASIHIEAIDLLCKRYYSEVLSFHVQNVIICLHDHSRTIRSFIFLYTTQPLAKSVNKFFIVAFYESSFLSKTLCTNTFNQFLQSQTKYFEQIKEI